MSYQVYIIQNETGRRYIGISEDPLLRLEGHNAGVSKWTSKYRPWKLVWLSEKMELWESRKLENLMKRQKGGLGLERITKEKGRWLSDGS